MGIALLTYYLSFFLVNVLFWMMRFDNDIYLNLIISGLLSFASMLSSVWLLDLLSYTFRDDDPKYKNTISKSGHIVFGGVFGLSGSVVSYLLLLSGMSIMIWIIFLCFWPGVLVGVIQITRRRRREHLQG